MNSSLKKMAVFAQQYANAHEAYCRLRRLRNPPQLDRELVDAAAAEDDVESGATERHVAGVIAPSGDLLTSQKRLAARQLVRVARDARVAAAATD